MRVATGAVWALIWFGICQTARSGPVCLDSRMHYSIYPQNDRCAHSTQSVKVALLFLNMGEMPHEAMWRRWFEDIGGLVYRGCKPDAQEAPGECSAHLQSSGPEAPGGPIAAQHLFNVYAPLPLKSECT